jgi:prefoldin subunit 5
MRNCKTHTELVDAIQSLNNKLNFLSPERVTGEAQLTKVTEQREALLIEIRQHRKKGHDGRPCPAAPRAA